MIHVHPFGETQEVGVSGGILKLSMRSARIFHSEFGGHR